MKETALGHVAYTGLEMGADNPASRPARRYQRGDTYLQKLPKKPRFFSAAAYSSSEWSLSHH